MLAEEDMCSRGLSVDVEELADPRRIRIVVPLDRELGGRGHESHVLAKSALSRRASKVARSQDQD